MCKGFTPPPKGQLNNFLAKLRKEKFGSERLNFGTLEQWLKENMIAPLDKNEPFVMAYHIHIDVNSINNSTFRFFVSTKSLIGHAVDVKKIHTDGTYKLV